MQDAPVNVGLIGAGNFARNLHLPNLARMPEAHLRGVCDLDPVILSGIQRQYGCELATTDHRKLMDDPAIEVIVIAVRDELQAPLAIEALKAGKHVYVEKPLSPTPSGCDAVADVQRATGKRAVVGFNRRYAPMYQAIKRIAEADGGPRSIHIRMADDAWRWAQGYPPGYLIQHDLCHLFDILAWLTESHITSVYCISARPDDDCIALRMASGAVASIHHSGHGTMDMPKERCELITERGGIHADDFVAS